MFLVMSADIQYKFMNNETSGYSLYYEMYKSKENGGLRIFLATFWF